MHSILAVQTYNGFNLIVGDLQARSVAYLTNRGKVESLKQAQELPPGQYGISNGVLGDRWVKVWYPSVLLYLIVQWASLLC